MGDLIHLHARRDHAEPWLSKRQIAAHLGVSTSWVERRAADSGLPFVRLGGINRYRASEVDRWAERTTS